VITITKNVEYYFSVFCHTPMYPKTLNTYNTWYWYYNTDTIPSTTPTMEISTIMTTTTTTMENTNVFVVLLRRANLRKAYLRQCLLRRFNILITISKMILFHPATCCINIWFYIDTMSTIFNTSVHRYQLCREPQPLFLPSSIHLQCPWSHNCGTAVNNFGGATHTCKSDVNIFFSGISGLGGCYVMLHSVT
jgi:hypothetical protein